MDELDDPQEAFEYKIHLWPLDNGPNPSFMMSKFLSKETCEGWDLVNLIEWSPTGQPFCVLRRRVGLA